jgi:hypothetical protein
MNLSDKLEARLQPRRLARQQLQEQTQKRHQKLYNIGVALGLTAGIAAFAFGAQTPTNSLPPVPSVSVEAAVPQPAAPPAVNIHDVKPGTRCNPYVNGVYVGELCGDHDAFQGRLDRAFAPED